MNETTLAPGSRKNQEDLEKQSASLYGICQQVMEGRAGLLLAASAASLCRAVRCVLLLLSVALLGSPVLHLCSHSARLAG
jgi:hypothetical protein